MSLPASSSAAPPRARSHHLSPALLATWIVVGHVALWTVLPLLVTRNLPLDVVEALAWGREWQWGYYKHPPLSGWLAEAMRFGPHDWSLYLLAQLMVAGGLAAGWLLGRDLLGARAATLALMAMEGVHYFNLSSTEFNANVVMFPFWALASLSLWRALTGKGLRWWALAGLSCGLGTLGKYVFLLLPASVFLYTVLHPVARRCWRTPGPWLALALFALLLAPHLRWAQAHDWTTLHYALGRGHAEEVAQQGSWGEEFRNFVLAQTLTLLPMFGLVRLLGPGMPSQRPSEERWLLWTLLLGPLLLIMSAAVIVHAKMLHMWASPFFIVAAPVWLALRPRVEAVAPTRRFMLAWGAWLMLLVSVYGSAQLWGPQRKHRLDRTSYPGAELAQTLSQRWHAQTGQPLRIVAGEEFVAGLVAHYAPEHPSVFYDADFSESLWLTPDEVRNQGALFVWPLSRGAGDDVTVPPDSARQVLHLLSRYPTLRVEPTLKLTTTWMGRPYTVAVAWAILPPAPAPQNFSAR